LAGSPWTVRPRCSAGGRRWWLSGCSVLWLNRVAGAGLAWSV